MSEEIQRKRFGQRFRQKRVIVIVIVVALIVIVSVAVALFFIMKQSRGNDQMPPAIAKDVENAKKSGQVRDKAQKEIARGDTKAASQSYDDAIRAEPDMTRKIKLAIDQSEVLFNAGKYDEAFDAAKKGEAITSDKYLIADWLSRLYEQHGDLQQAANYYILAGQWASSPTNVSGLDKAYYDGEAARVNAEIQKDKKS